MLFLSTVSRGKEAEFLILWECSVLFSWEMSEAAADLNERSSSLKICYTVINAGFCWWAADGPLMSLAVLQGTAVPPAPFPPLPAHPGSGFHRVKAKISLQHSRAMLSLKKGVVPGFIIQPAASLQPRLMLFTGTLALNIWLPESRSYNGNCWYAATWGLLSIYFI